MKTALILGCLCVVACTAKPATNPCDPACMVGKMVDAGCIVASPTAVQSMQSELEAGAVPAWAACLHAGGSPASCNISCDAGAR